MVKSRRTMFDNAKNPLILQTKFEDFQRYTQLRLTLNPKTQIYPASRGIDFAGYRTWSTHIKPRKRNVKAARKRFRALSKSYARYDVNLEDVKPRVMSFLGYTKHCQARQTTESTLRHLVCQRGE